MLALADWVLTAIHVAVVLAFILLWIPRRTTRLHGWLVLATGFSWFGLGLFHGLGYCFLTDLEWRVKRARGVTRLPSSFIKYAADFVTGRDVPATWVHAVAALTFVSGCAAALWRHRQARRGVL